MGAEVHHIGLLTARPGELLDYYTEVLGFAVEETKTVPRSLMASLFDLDCPGRVSKLRLNGILLELISGEDQDPAPRTGPGPGVNHWALGVPDKNLFLQKLKERGIFLLEFKKGEKTVVFLRDPDNNLIEVCQL